MRTTVCYLLSTKGPAVFETAVVPQSPNRDETLLRIDFGGPHTRWRIRHRIIGANVWDLAPGALPLPPLPWGREQTPTRFRAYRACSKVVRLKLVFPPWRCLLKPCEPASPARPLANRSQTDAHVGLLLTLRPFRTKISWFRCVELHVSPQ